MGKGKKGFSSSFNPRVRAGRDLINEAGEDISTVSIHASARDATFAQLLRLPSLPCFNPRVRAGRDLPSVRHYGDVSFQSTRPRGTRPAPHSDDGSVRGFNPRVRAGRDSADSQ